MKNRKYGKLIAVCFAILGCFAVVGISHADEATLRQLKSIEKEAKEVVKNDSSATVALYSASGDTGSGVIVSKDGLILTAAHVVQGEDWMKVIFPDGREADAKVLGANYTRDAAMVKLEGKGPWPFVELGDSDKLKVGDFVVAMGHAKGFDPTRRAPVRLGRLHTDGKQRFMISECTLIGGDSGGPLFDRKGRLVGIHSSIGPLLRINNHVPISVYKTDWERLLRGEQWGQLGLHPMVDPETPALGCAITQVIGVEGVVVGDVVIDSPADKAGLQAGDVITRLSERVLESPRDLFRELGRHRPGEEIDLVVFRRGEAYKAKLTLGRRGDFSSLR